ncbi:MAG: hypothetical protein WD058_08075 [Dehalococcoidia bacterium]
MADGTRHGERAPGAQEQAKARRALTRAPQDVPAPLVGSQAAIARAVAGRAGNAAAVRAVGAARSVEGVEGVEGVRRAPEDEPAVVAAEPVAAPAAVPIAVPVDEPVDEVAPYRAEMLRYINETTAAHDAAAAGRETYNATVRDLARAANPSAIEGVPASMAGKLAAAQTQFRAFEAATATAAGEFDSVIARGDGDYNTALDRREGLATGAQVEQWLVSVGTARGIYQGVQEGLPAAMTGLVDAALGFANIGKELEQPEYVQAMLPLADRAQAAGAQAPPPRPDLAAVAARGTAHDRTSARFAWGDAVNNSAAVVTTTIGFALTTVAATVAGTISTSIGIAFAAVGTILAIRSAILAGSAKKRLAAAEKYLSTEGATKVAQYAKQQKSTKQKRQAGLAVLGAATVAIGIAGIATGGIGLAVAGLVVALAGLGVVLGKYIHSKRKRAAEAKAAAHLAGTYEASADAGDAEAVRIVRDVNQGDRAKLEAWCATAIANQRHNSAAQVVAMLGSAVPSERFNGQTIVEALGVKPADVLTALDAGDAGAAIGLVERKLASW